MLAGVEPFADAVLKNQKGKWKVGIMNRTKIEWVKNQDGTQGYTINPVKGLCPVGCSYCYARRMYKRFKWNPEIRYNPDWTIELPDKPSRIFVGSTMELFGDWISDRWLKHLFDFVKQFPQHTFIFLTKQPQNLPKWSPFPNNCWVGVSATNADSAHSAIVALYSVKAKVRFLSLEPLLEWKPLFSWFFPPHLNWLIIGQQTPASKKTQPKIEWVEEIVEATDNANIPVFLKSNLESLFNIGMMPNDCLTGAGFLRQEFPKQ